MPADRISFPLFDADSAPLTTASPTFVDYRDRAGASRTPPAITHLGGGQYGFIPTDDDEATGCVFLIDGGVTASPRRVSGSLHSQASPFVGWHLEDGAGALWTGAAPTFGLYDDFGGSPRTPPSIVTVAGAYLFCFTPSSADLAVDCAFRLDAPANAYPSYIGGSLDKPYGYDQSPGPLKNPALDLVNFLDGKAAGGVTLTKGTNLFAGPMRTVDRTPSPAVFLLNSGGVAPSPNLNEYREATYQPSVQIQVRGPVGDFQVGEQLAVDVLRWLHQSTAVTGYLTVFAGSSTPVYVGDDTDQHPTWVLNVTTPYVAKLA